MTLVVALKTFAGESEAVMVASDSRASLGVVTYEVRKIFPIVGFRGSEEVPLAVMGGAGDAAVVKWAYGAVEAYLREGLKEWGDTPTSEQFREAVGRIEEILVARFRKLREVGIEPDVELVLAGVGPDGKASIYKFDERGLAQPVHDSPGFAILGRGAITGGLLLLRLFGRWHEGSLVLDLDSAAVLTTFIIELVSEVDPSVSPFLGENYLMRVEGGRVALGPLKEEAVREYKERARRRRQLLASIWALTDLLGEAEVDKAAKRLAKRISQT